MTRKRTHFRQLFLEFGVKECFVRIKKDRQLETLTLKGAPRRIISRRNTITFDQPVQQHVNNINAPEPIKNRRATHHFDRESENSVFHNSNEDTNDSHSVSTTRRSIPELISIQPAQNDCRPQPNCEQKQVASLKKDAVHFSPIVREMGSEASGARALPNRGILRSAVRPIPVNIEVDDSCADVNNQGTVPRSGLGAFGKNTSSSATEDYSHTAGNLASAQSRILQMLPSILETPPNQQPNMNEYSRRLVPPPSGVPAGVTEQMFSTGQRLERYLALSNNYGLAQANARSQQLQTVPATFGQAHPYSNLAGNNRIAARFNDFSLDTALQSSALDAGNRSPLMFAHNQILRNLPQSHQSRPNPPANNYEMASSIQLGISDTVMGNRRVRPRDVSCNLSPIQEYRMNSTENDSVLAYNRMLSNYSQARQTHMSPRATNYQMTPSILSPLEPQSEMNSGMVTRSDFHNLSPTQELRITSPEYTEGDIGPAPNMLTDPIKFAKWCLKRNNIQ